MILNFRHKGLKRLYERGDRSKLPAEMVSRIEEVLFYLDTAVTLDDIDRPAFRLHPLKYNRRGEYAVDVRGPWRIVFRFETGNALM